MESICNESSCRSFGVREFVAMSLAISPEGDRVRSLLLCTIDSTSAHASTDSGCRISITGWREGDSSPHVIVSIAAHGSVALGSGISLDCPR